MLFGVFYKTTMWNTFFLDCFVDGFNSIFLTKLRKCSHVWEVSCWKIRFSSNKCQNFFSDSEIFFRNTFWAGQAHSITKTKISIFPWALEMLFSLLLWFVYLFFYLICFVINCLVTFFNQSPNISCVPTCHLFIAFILFEMLVLRRCWWWQYLKEFWGDWWKKSN